MLLVRALAELYPNPASAMFLHPTQQATELLPNVWKDECLGHNFLNPFPTELVNEMKEDPTTGIPLEAKYSSSSLRACFATYLPENGIPHDYTDTFTGHTSKKQGINVNKNQANYQEQLGKSIESIVKVACVIASANQPKKFNWNDALPAGLLHAVRSTMPHKISPCALDCRNIAEDLRNDMRKARQLRLLGSGADARDEPSNLRATLAAGARGPSVDLTDDAKPEAAPAAPTAAAPPLAAAVSAAVAVAWPLLPVASGLEPPLGVAPSPSFSPL